MGCFVVTVSGFEIQLALRCGYEGSSIIYNGNGKQKYIFNFPLNNLIGYLGCGFMCKNSSRGIERVEIVNLYL